MKFRKSAKSDIKEIMRIIREAQEYFKNQGIDQWQNNYPNEDVINSDIEKGESYVLENEGKVVATTVISFAGEKNYDNIYEGQWITLGDFAVIHRIAVDNKCKGKGLSSLLIKSAEEMCMKKGIKSIKADTHEDNISMKKLLTKNGFKYCGIIHLEYGAKRVAFEKTL